MCCCTCLLQSVCGVEADKKDKGTLLVVGSAGGELVVLREELVRWNCPTQRSSAQGCKC